MACTLDCMRHTRYFLIQPKEAAGAHFSSAVSGDLAALMLEPTLTSRDCGGRSAWCEPDIMLVVKLLYVASVRELDPLSSDAEAARVLGSASITAETFDRWWSIRGLNYEPSEGMHDYLKAVLEKTAVTGNELVDTWLKNLESTGR